MFFKAMFYSEKKITKISKNFTLSRIELIFFEIKILKRGSWAT